MYVMYKRESAVSFLTPKCNCAVISTSKSIITRSVQYVVKSGQTAAAATQRTGCCYKQSLTSTLALPWICVLGQRFDHYECGRLSWLGQLYGAL